MLELTKVFSQDEFDRALASWEWIDLEGKTPVFASLFGDVVFKAGSDFWFLDTLQGTLSREWTGEEALRAALQTDEGQDQYLLAGLAMAAARAGIELGEDEVYDFSIPPVLGGPFEVDNIVAISFVVSLTIAGQIHDQVRNLPPGTQITEFRLS